MPHAVYPHIGPRRRSRGKNVSSPYFSGARPSMHRSCPPWDLDVIVGEAHGVLGTRAVEEEGCGRDLTRS